MDFMKYVSLLDREALFFERVDRLGDPFEGSLSDVNINMRPQLYPDLTDDFRRSLGRAFEQSRQMVLVNCWHENAIESDFMWKLYAKGNAGVAVMSSFDSLSKCFTCEQSVSIGRMNYVDYGQTFIPEGNAYSTCLHKRKSFEHEREVRALTSLGKLGDGTYCDVDLSTLVNKVFVAPYADDWFLKLVKSVTDLYGLHVPVRRSALAGSPVF